MPTIGGRNWSLSTKTLALRDTPTFLISHMEHPPQLLVLAVMTPAMITLKAVNDVRAARLRRDAVRTAVAFVAEPSCWRSGWSLLSANPWRRTSAQ